MNKNKMIKIKGNNRYNKIDISLKLNTTQITADMSGVTFSEIKVGLAITGASEEVTFAIKISGAQGNLFINPLTFFCSHIAEFLAWQQPRYKSLGASSIYKKGQIVILKMQFPNEYQVKYTLSAETSKQFCDKLHQLVTDVGNNKVKGEY